MALEVQVIESSFVAPSEAMPHKGLWVSSLDLSLANRGYTPTVYFYRSAVAATANLSDVAARLKESLAKALVAFYPFAGRVGVGVGDDGRTQINCNSEGALFVVARSELTVDDIIDLMPSTELRRRFVPHIEPPSVILAIQVTFLKCGGIVLGTALHHVSMDALGAFHFFQTWSAISRDGDGARVELPCHDRTLLRARSPPVVHPEALSVFCPTNNLTEPRGPVASRAFPISKDQIATLKHICGGGASTFCAVSALVWQSACVARRLPADAEARLSFSANIRRKLRPPIPDRYLGNAIVSVYAAGAAQDIASEALESVAGRIKGAVSRVDDELVRSVIDYYELSEPDNRPRRGLCLKETELRVVSWLGMPVHDADFGWGMPWRMTRAEPATGGYVHMMNSGPAADSGITVVASLETAVMEEFERLLYAKF
ncbi:hypothetical protein PVAP13_2NG224400 [Panicum virgatum]|uniref:Uncharacterized protein n=2 Tax=Panicum virgatum TaxID=38727 RepID=A0A8T0VHN0_PANVG|nr:hypothetical protein PVAP13_2NG224400 [Panicum virgatum]